MDGCSPKYPAPKNLEPFSPKFLDEQEREWYNGFVAGCAAANGDPNGAQTRAASGLKLRRALASMRTALAAVEDECTFLIGDAKAPNGKPDQTGPARRPGAPARQVSKF